MLPATAERVSLNTAAATNEQILRRTEANIVRCAARGPRAIERRLQELDREWDIERTLEAMAPSITLLGMTLGLTVSRKWFVLPLAVQAFFLQHALQGWCPPLPILRRLGVRTQAEIDLEKDALNILLADFRTGDSFVMETVLLTPEVDR
jgi:hypothetical protein